MIGMSVVLHEIKKIWNMKILLVIAVLCALFYFMFMDWQVRHAQVGTSVEAVITRELAERYGTRMTADEWDNFFAEQIPATAAELEYRMALDPIFAEMGILTYADFIRAYYMEEWDYDTWRILERMFSSENDWVATRLDTLALMQQSMDAIPMQVDMEGEFVRYGYSEWFFQIMEDVLVSDDVPAFVEEHLAPLTRRADEFIHGSNLFAENGVYGYEQFLERWYDREFVSFEHERMRWQLWQVMLGAEADFVYRKVGVLDEIYRRYTSAPSREFFERDITDWAVAFERRLAEITPFAQRRIDTIEENRDWLNIMDRGAFWITVIYFGHLTLLAVLAALALIMPLVTVDRMRNVHSLQYSSRLGRKVLRRQTAAVLLSSALLTTLLLAVFGGIYFGVTGVLTYWNHNVYSVSNQTVLLFDFTFGQYLIILTVLVYLAALAAAGFAFIVSRFSRNLIAATIKVIPVFAALAFFVHQLNNGGAPVPFSMVHRFYLWTNIVGIEVIACALLLALSLGLALWVARREKRVDAA